MDCAEVGKVHYLDFEGSLLICAASAQMQAAVESKNTIVRLEKMVLLDDPRVAMAVLGGSSSGTYDRGRMEAESA